MNKFILLVLLLATCSAGPDSDQTSLIGSHIDGAWPAWSPDGKWLSYSWDNDLWLKPVAGGKEKLATLLDGDEYQASWDPSDPGGRLAFVNYDGDRRNLIVLDLNPYEHAVWYSSGNPINWPCFSRDGGRIFFLEAGKLGIRYIESPGATPGVIAGFTGSGEIVRCIQTSRADDTILCIVSGADNSYNMASIPISGGAPDTLIRREQEGSHSRWIFFAGESTDGKRVAYYEADGVGAYSGTRFDDFRIRLSLFDRDSRSSTVLKEAATHSVVFLSGDPTGCAAAWSPGDGYLAHVWIGNSIYDNYICVDKP